MARALRHRRGDSQAIAGESGERIDQTLTTTRQHAGFCIGYKMIDYTKIDAQIVTATPALVDWLLSLNTHNRELKKNHVATMSRSIKNKKWYLTNQGIGITASGFLCDGQNRLHAIKESGYPPVRFVLVTGLEDEAQAVVDIHAKRSQADVIKLLLNQSVSTQLVAALNVLLRMRSNGDRFTYSNQKPTEFELSDYIENNTRVITTMMPAIGSSSRASVCGALIEYAQRFDLDSAADLASQIKTGANLSMTSPAYKLRSWLDRNKGGGGSSQTEAYSVCVTACIAHARGDSLNLIRATGSWDRLPRQKKL